MSAQPTRRALLLGASALALVGCSERSQPQAPSGQRSPADSEYVFANAATAPTLDPTLTDNVETNRVARQVLDGLVAPDSLTGEPVPSLAVGWTASEDGLTLDFELRRDVVFHDGEQLTAQAVCRNFERWASASVRDTTTGRHSLFDAIFRRGTAQGSLYDGCVAVDEHTFRLLLTRRYPALVTSLTHPAFGIASTASIEEDTVGTAPVGTGPFRVVRGLEAGAGQLPENPIELEAFPEHWNGTGDIERLTFVAILDPRMRYIALESGRVDGYDLVGLSDFARLARDGVQVLQRDPYTLSYLGIRTSSAWLDSLEVRGAVMSAIDRQALVREHYPEGTGVAQDFMPARFDVPDGDAGYPGYNPQDARRALEDSGYDGTPLRFAYPTGASRSWALEPERLYADISAQLVRCGFRIEPVPVPWSIYAQTLRSRSADHDLFLSGLSGGLRDQDFFSAVLFSARTPELDLDSESLHELVEEAAQEPDGEQRQELYSRVGDQVAQHRAALPLAFPITAVAVNQRTASFPLSSTGFEPFREVELTQP
ncbi:ABC transporter substrate-binding protein [Kocuria sp. p3-SID1433]|uniref:ABC transporter substrate-binding protein n=1 Tax=unclassified Kocuria TaxID=2649579 RepID=UPI0021A60CB9|nr:MULTISPECIES: ABC transporter substrate-binding protein [unclassified Kocuria]MCT1601092.1 ABC transporter substrate-binding protein [Kocuria sp. p3-SID1428]MCT2181226.1 ABC transporter substrate-binding protein [Kocuria sp. p3-SID1433]